MERDVTKYPVWVRRIVGDQDSLIGFFAMWAIGLTIFPTGGFYLATIISPASNANGIQHYWDLRIEDMHFGGYGALAGLALGVCLGLWATFVYPAAKERESTLEAVREHEIYHELTHKEEIMTIPGQEPEHPSAPPA
jgi:hypothetical protein